MRILFVTSNRIGDAVISTGILDHLIHTYPNCSITIVCGPVAAGVFDRMPNHERTILFEKRPRDLHWLILWQQVVRTRWDLVVDLRQSVLSYLVRTRRRAIKPRGTAGLRKFQQLAAVIGLPPAQAPLPTVWTGEADRARARALLPQQPVIGLGPTANWPPKAWPPERFAALFHALQATLPGATPAIFAGPGPAERAMAAPLLNLLPGAIDLCGVLTLPEAAACLQRCAIYIGNDSGLMHLAAASGIPTVGLCSTTQDRAEEMAPAGRCASWALGDGTTMAGLTVASAQAVAERLLAKTSILHS